MARVRLGSDAKCLGLCLAWEGAARQALALCELLLPFSLTFAQQRGAIKEQHKINCVGKSWSASCLHDDGGIVLGVVLHFLAMVKCHSDTVEGIDLQLVGKCQHLGWHLFFKGKGALADIISGALGVSRRLYYYSVLDW